MKTITLTKVQYDDFVYPAVAVNAAQTLQDLRLTSKVLDVLEAHGVGPDSVNGRPLEQGFKLKSSSAEFAFEDAQAQFLVGRLEAAVPRYQAWRAREILPIIDALKA